MLDEADNGLVDQIYDASFEPAVWRKVMNRLCAEVGAHTACLTELDIIDGYGEAITSMADDSSVQDYMEHWTDQNSLLLVDDPVRYVRDWRLAIIRDREWMPPAALLKSSYYNEFLRPMGADHSIMVRLSLEGTMVAALNIARTDGKGVFEDAEIARIGRYQRHLIRAMTMGRRLRLSNSALDQIDALLDTSPKALFFVNRRGQIRHHTASAERLLRSTRVLAMREKKLRAIDPPTDTRLQRLIAKTIAGVDLPADPSILIKPQGRDNWLVVSVSPLGRRSVAAFSSEPLVLVGVAEVPPVVTPAERLRTTFQLTAAEANVALLIGDGLKIAQVAERCGISVHTVRVQLSAAFAKTGCHRQADLVRLLLQQGFTGSSKPS